MRVFLDFEASSLGDDSFPIEVGWVFEDGREESHLIRPATGWTDWDPSAEAIHGLRRDRLLAQGEPHAAVAARMLVALSPHTIFASAPSWDGKWLSVLLRSAGFPRHALRLRDSDEALLEAAREGLAQLRPPSRREAVAGELVDRARRSLAGLPAEHRALADARRERDLWLAVRHGAVQTAERLRSSQGLDVH
jgi:hypothetical protein